MGYEVISEGYKSAEQFAGLLRAINADVLLVHGVLPGLQEAREAGMHSVLLLPPWRNTQDDVCFVFGADYSMSA
jgi:hypothetical protein